MAYILGGDVWEGALDIDENTLLSAGVKFLVIRLNDINGGSHIDTNFVNQWGQAERFLRAPYFVYSPWTTGQKNAQFLMDNLPLETTRIFADIEVSYAGYSPKEYANNVRAFVSQIKAYKKPLSIYTGGWFLNMLSEWPKDVDYWWARYPNWVYPSQKTSVSWEWITNRVNQLAWSPDYGTYKSPGPVVLWQCTADRYIMPGCAGRPMDINIYNGTLDVLSGWWGQPMKSVEQRLTELEERVEYLEDNLLANVH